MVEEEAERVRTIFRRYLELGSLTRLIIDLGNGSKVACRTGLELLVSAMPPPSGRVSTGSSRFPILSPSSASPNS